MRLVGKLGVAGAMTVILGIGSAIYGSGYVALKQSVANGPWVTIPKIGTEEAGPYVRAFIALHGLLALTREEAIYFTATTDSAGDRLSSKCRYRVSGRALDARWWTITAYGRDDFLIENSEDKYSIGMNEVGNKKFSFTVSRKRVDGHWLPIDGRGSISLTLRLYNPGDTVMNAPATTNMPRIEKRSCA